MSFLEAPKRILVIDDEEGVVEYIRIILRTRGYESIPAYDGEQGLALLQSEQPDLVICDLRMPKMSGLELARRRKELPRDLASIPLLIISSMGHEQQKPDGFWCEGLGCEDFMAKPFDALSLLGRVEALLRREKYRSNETPEPSKSAAEPGRQGGRRPTRSTRREFTVQADPEPVEVVRASLAVGHQDPSLLDGGQVLRGVRLPSARSRVLDTSPTFATPENAEVAVLREEPAPAPDGNPVAFDERYLLARRDHSWKIVGIRQKALTDGED